MIKFDSTLITFTEVPDEIALCINCSLCPFHCHECFEPWLQTDRGEILTIEILLELIALHPHISCLCFMGGINDPNYLFALCHDVKQNYPQLKLALYSGDTRRHPLLEKIFDYYKIGPFIPEYGPLNYTTTNQKFYKKQQDQWIDITYKFQKEKI